MTERHVSVCEVRLNGQVAVAAEIEAVRWPHNGPTRGSWAHARSGCRSPMGHAHTPLLF